MQGGRQSCHSLVRSPFSPSSCSAYPTDAAAGEWASAWGGRGGRTTGRGCHPPALRASAPRTPLRPQSSPGVSGRFTGKGTGPAGTHPREQQLSLPAPSQPGEQVARPPLPPPDTQDSTQCVPGCLNAALSGQRSRPSWRLEWALGGGQAASFLIPEPAGPEAGVGAGAPGPRGFGQGPCSGQGVAAKSTAHVHLAFGGAREGAVPSQPGVGTHWGPAPTAPRTSPMMSPKRNSTWMRPVAW